MTELARGTIADRPWGRTLAALGLRGLTGELAILADGGKRYAIVFHQGAVVAAASPLVTDAAARIALTSGLVSSMQVADIVRKQAASPERDEIDLIAEIAKLQFDQAQRLRRRVVAARAARTFSVERGEFVVDDFITLDVAPGAELDIRAVVYLGARGNLSEQRLSVELGQLGVWFRIKPDAYEDLPQFGLGEVEHALIPMLKDGATLHALETQHPGLEQRTVRAFVYALVTCGAAEAEARAKLPPPMPLEAPTIRRPAGAVTPPPGTAPVARAPISMATPPTGVPISASLSAGGAAIDAPTVQRPKAAPAAKAPSDPAAAAKAVTTAPPNAPASAFPTDPPTDRKHVPPPAGTAPVAPRAAPIGRAPNASAKAARASAAGAGMTAEQVLELITARLKLLDTNVDHFALLGVDREAAPEAIRTAYFTLARQLHPDRLSALGIDDNGKQAQKLFASVNTAFSTLSDPMRRHEYLDVLRRGGAAAIQAEQAQAEAMTMRVLDAEEAFRRGEMALRRDNTAGAIAEFQKAIELNPDETDYHALLAWAQFCAAPDKMAAGAPTRAVLEKNVLQTPRAVAPRFYLGRVERMLGRDQEALKHFKDVLKISPGHAEASTEVRVIESRMAAATDDKKGGGGLFGRLKR